MISGWRVGTLSMAVSLILMGILLFLSQWKGSQVFDQFLLWWPLVLVLLGAELLLYIGFKSKENVFIKYDIISILFVGFVGAFCIMFAVLLSTGVMSEIRYAVNSVERVQDLPPVDRTISQGIKRVVIETSDYIKVDKSEDKAIHLLGNYSQSVSLGSRIEEYKSDDIVSIREIGSTVYVSVKGIPRKNGIARDGSRINATLVVPQELSVVYNGKAM